jgi:predicted DNA-binding transcriptional regulator YafY
MKKRTGKAANVVNEMRLTQLKHLLEVHQPVSAATLMDRLEISRPTLMRDFEKLRSLGMPIEYDRALNGYRISKDSPQYGYKQEFPGLWLDVRQCYALLTLLNVLLKLDLGLLKYYVLPLKDAMKLFLCDRQLRFQGFDRKVVVEIENVQEAKPAVCKALSWALQADQRVLLIGSADKPLPTGECSPQRFVLTASGWYMDCVDHKTDEIVRLALADIDSVEYIYEDGD